MWPGWPPHHQHRAQSEPRLIAGCAHEQGYNFRTLAPPPGSCRFEPVDPTRGPRGPSTSACEPRSALGEEKHPHRPTVRWSTGSAPVTSSTSLRLSSATSTMAMLPGLCRNESTTTRVKLPGSPVSHKSDAVVKSRKVAPHHITMCTSVKRRGDCALIYMELNFLANKLFKLCRLLAHHFWNGHRIFY